MMRDARRQARDEVDLTDEVVAALAEEGKRARAEASVPSAAVVWWRAQLRARQEAERAVTRPITVVEGVAAAAAAGLALGIAGFALEWLRDVLHIALGWSTAAASVAADVGVFEISNRWVAFPVAMLIGAALLAPLAVYLITADE